MPATAGASGTGAYRRYARVYDLVWSAAPYDRFVDLCLEAAGAHGTDVRRVAVAACGTGNAVIELARRGYPDVPVIDSMVWAVKMAEAMAGMGLKHSKMSWPYPPQKRIDGFLKSVQGH